MKIGLYEQLISEALAEALDKSPLSAARAPLSQDAAQEVLARYVQQAVKRALGELGRSKRDAQIALVNRLIEALSEAVPGAIGEDDRVRPEMLEALSDAGQSLGAGALPRPGIPLRHSELIVNGPRDLRVGAELSRELPSADRVDLLMSFIKWSGFVEVKRALTQLRDRGGQLRILTTTYMRATEIEALEALARLGAEIKISYDSRRTRLHAKAWLLHRDTGFSTAIIGSSNLSHSALRDGCEWNVRLSQQDNPALLNKFQATFDQYWHDPAFEPYELSRVKEALAVRSTSGQDALVSTFWIQARPHQIAVLEALQTERESGHHHNLVVAATGTGKTVIAALDYARLCRAAGRRIKLLFIAHREQILEQSRATFRHVLRDGAFGEKLTGQEKPILGDHVFASVQSLHSDRLAALAPDAYEMVIIDEFHHAAAASYEALLQHLQPTHLLGLTATPERADGRSILRWFDDRIAAESRLWDALDEGLLCPFQYFGVHDGTDLSRLNFRAGRYVIQELEQLYTADEIRAHRVLTAVHEKVRNPLKMRAIGFCVSVAHAKFMAAFFHRHGLPAAAIHSETSAADRAQALRALEAREICCVFAVDLLNEGVDLPWMDTALFLRPTESATVFIQQLGRGLRLHEEKACLTVLDFVGLAHQGFRFDLRLRALTGGGTRKALSEAVERGFPQLPSGCAIELDEISKGTILKSLRQQLKWAGLADELTEEMTLKAFLDQAAVSLEEVYAKAGRTFTALRASRGWEEAPETPLSRQLARMLHVDDPGRLQAWRAWLRATPSQLDLQSVEGRLLGGALGARSVAEAAEIVTALEAEPTIKRELLALLSTLDERRRHETPPCAHTPLRLHAHYTRLEISAALEMTGEGGRWIIPQAGVYQHAARRCDVLYVTLDKDEQGFTPTTMYQDYPISRGLFHWESQSRTRAGSSTGQRYQSPPSDWQILLFVRRARKDERGETRPFMYLGPVRYVSHEGERPMAITWQLDHLAPAGWFQQVKLAS